MTNVYTDRTLEEKMLAFIQTRDGDYFDEWYASPRDFAATILSDFAKYLGIELIVPEHIPQKTKPEIDRQKVFEALLPGIQDLFNLEFKKYTKEQP
jgi:hypothetical protein